MPCRFTGLFFIQSTGRNLMVSFNETSTPHILSMNYFEDAHDADNSPFPRIYNFIVHDQVYLITRSMVHHASQLPLVYRPLDILTKNRIRCNIS